MPDDFYKHPILNSPYAPPARHWELDAAGQPTQRVIDARRKAEFITPIPAPRKRRAGPVQPVLDYDAGGLTTESQQYEVHARINEVRLQVARWRAIPDSGQWRVTSVTAQLLKHWRHHRFNSLRPFFCQVEAVETAIWLTEVAPHSSAGMETLQFITRMNKAAIPGCPAWP